MAVTAVLKAVTVRCAGSSPVPGTMEREMRHRRPTNLEMANQMFKDAFLVKKTRFSKLHPQLSDEELHKMTVEYFKNLPDDERKRGQL